MDKLKVFFGGFIIGLIAMSMCLALAVLGVVLVGYSFYALVAYLMFLAAIFHGFTRVAEYSHAKRVLGDDCE